MGLQSLHLFNGKGRIKGSYVYMLLCKDSGGLIYVKVGKTDNPDVRLSALRSACPFIPEIFATAHTISSTDALTVEQELQSAFQRWHSSGEWFCFARADRGAFNRAWQRVFAAHSRPSWTLQWEQVAVKPIAAAAKARRQFVHYMFVKRGRAYRDFMAQS